MCLWLVPSTFASYDCSEVCPSCTTPLNKGLTKSPATDEGFFVWVGQLTCSCYVPRMNGNNVMKRVAVAIVRKAYLRPGKGHAATRIFKGTSRIAAKRGMDWVMVYVVLLLYTLPSFFDVLLIPYHYSSLLSATFLLTLIAMLRRRRSSRRSSSRLVEYTDTKSPTVSEKKSDNFSVSVTASPYTSSPGSPRSPSTPASFA